MSSAREKDMECTCNNKLFLDDLDSITKILMKEDFDKNKRYEIWLQNKPYCFLEYIDSENRWYFFTKSIELNVDENNNWSSYILEVSDIKEESN